MHCEAGNLHWRRLSAVILKIGFATRVNFGVVTDYIFCEIPLTRRTSSFYIVCNEIGTVVRDNRESIWQFQPARGFF